VVIFELVFRLVSERDDVVLLRVLRGNARETLGGRRQRRGGGSGDVISAEKAQ
jgi:hypothetical protein